MYLGIGGLCGSGRLSVRGLRDITAIMSKAAPFVTGDMPANHWIDRRIPRPVRPFLKLMRIDRPIGTWLLLWPCWWSIGLSAHHAAPASGGGTIPGWAPTGLWGGGWPDPVLFVLFGIGALLTRGAGCTFNDILDRDLDAAVERTRSRPIPAGQVSVTQAAMFMIALWLLALFVLLGFNEFALWVGVASLLPAFVYPFSKRFTHWPQFFLGLAFNWGALLGWAAVASTLSWAAFVLYGAGIAWTLAYDTIYAHQDREGDALFGVRSTALLLSDATRPWLVGFFAVTIAGIGVAGWLSGLAWPFYAGLTVAAGQAIRQVRGVRLDEAGNCLAIFKSNKWFGWIVFAAIVAGSASV